MVINHYPMSMEEVGKLLNRWLENIKKQVQLFLGRPKEKDLTKEEYIKLVEE